MALFLAVFVTLGLSLSAVKASGMAAKMSTSTEMGTSGHGDCHGCGDCDIGKAKPMTCASSVCASSIMAVLPQGLPDALAEPSAIFSRSYALLCGRAFPPEPYPPRPGFLG